MKGKGEYRLNQDLQDYRMNGMKAKAKASADGADDTDEKTKAKSSGSRL